MAAVSWLIVQLKESENLKVSKVVPATYEKTFHALRQEIDEETNLQKHGTPREFVKVEGHDTSHEVQLSIPMSICKEFSCNVIVFLFTRKERSTKESLTKTKSQKVFKFDQSTSTFVTVAGKKDPMPWESFLYPHPKTARMEFYNSLVKPLYEAINNSGDFKNYLCDQQKLRWEVKVATEKLQSKIEYFHSDASGIPMLRKLPRQPKKKDKLTCENLVKKIEKELSDGKKLARKLQTRRSHCNWKSDEEVEYLSASLVTVNGLVKEIGSILQDVKGSLFHLSRSRVARESTTSNQSRVARRKKENARKCRKQAKQTLLKREKEIMTNIFGEEKGLKIMQNKEVVIDEGELNCAELYKLKPKFHLKALRSLVASGVFGGDVLEHIICTEARLTKD